MMTTLDASRDKAYTALVLGTPRNEDTSGAIAQRMGTTPSSGGLAKLPHILLLQGAIRIKVGSEAIGAIGVGGAPGAAPKRVSTRSVIGLSIRDTAVCKSPPSTKRRIAARRSS